ncbi:unnamed protein product [Ceratitis capitata]|uniref:(Mediterranean fruit fly) hypothetical protein n=1 Tax=Ceratitis capitata TaxID=7213 RepID=A0A811V5Y9_CERCA|nr:unnamed protein product [Ceratitis capitata]
MPQTVTAATQSARDSNNAMSPYTAYDVELQKANLQEANNCANGQVNNGGSGNNNNVSSLATAIPLAQLLSKPGALNALSSLTALGGLTDLLGGLATLNGPPIQTTGVHRTKSFASTRFRSHNHAGDGNADSEKTRNKFNPY